jgi:hypothetical protein
MRKILNTDPKTRYSVQDIRDHPWYKQVTPHEKDGIIVGVNSIPVSNSFLILIRLNTRLFRILKTMDLIWSTPRSELN